MLEMFYPRRYEASAYVIPCDHCHANGVRGVIFDIGNTLTSHDAPADDQTVELSGHLHQIGMNACLLSNNKRPRVKHFADKMGSAYVYKVGKPRRDGYERAVEWMGTDRETTIFVGSQLFTDVYGANRAGIYSILVEPMNPRREIQIVLKRHLEKPVLYFYKRQCRRRAREEGLGNGIAEWAERQECTDS